MNNDILSRFSNVTSVGNDQYRADCPACGDRKQHLYIKEQDGKLLLDCKKGCKFADIVSAAGLDTKDCFPPSDASNKMQVVREHFYKDADGKILAKKQICKKDGGDKIAFWYRCSNGSYSKGLSGLKMPLYHLDLLMSSQSDTVLVVEGEKDVETCEKLGYTATTSPNGASAKWNASYTACLKGKKVYILTDNDDAGRTYGLNAAAAIEQVASSVTVIHAVDIYPYVKEKGDISDIVAEVGAEQAKAMLENAMKNKAQYHNITAADFKPEKVDTDLLDRLRELKPHKNFQPNDIGNSTLFSEMFKDSCVYNVTAKEWYVYDGACWQRDIGGMLTMKKAKQLLDALAVYLPEVEDSYRKSYLENLAKLQQLRFRKTMIEDARDNYFVKSSDFDCNEWLFNCKNGTYDLKNGYFRQHNPKDMITKMSNVVYDENASSKEFERFISQVMCGDMSKVRYLQKLFGYSLTGDTSQECFYILYGKTTRNGKGTLMETISYMMGGESGYAMSSAPETFQVQKHRDSRQASGDIARLNKARFLNVSEPHKGMIFDVALIKQLTGRDTITARHLHEREFQFVPSFKLFINTNYLPYVNDDTLFASDRVSVITFDRHFGEADRDLGLKNRLKQQENISGLFNWCVEGLRLYQQEGLVRPETVAATTENYRVTSDRTSTFISDCLIPTPGVNCTRADAYKAYKLWCADNGFCPENKSNFISRLGDKLTIQRTGTVGNITCHGVICGYTICEDYTAQEDLSDKKEWDDTPL